MRHWVNTFTLGEFSTKISDYCFCDELDLTGKDATRFYMLVLYGIVRSMGYRNVVEIGGFLGNTSMVLAKAAKANGGKVSVFECDAECVDKIRRRTSSSYPQAVVVYHLDTGKDSLPEMEADFVFIDGNHLYDGVKKDWNVWSKRVVVGGMVAFHDAIDEQITRLLDEVFPNPNWEMLGMPNDCGLVLARRVA